MLLDAPTISLQQIEAQTHALVADRDRWTEREVSALVDRVGILGAPFVVYLLADAPRFPVELVRPHAGAVFAEAHRPELIMKRGAWIRLFRRIGYTVNGKSSPAPRDPLILWRGCHPEHLDNMTWTADRDVAVMYAGKPGRHLYWAEVPAPAVLCVLDDHTDHPSQHIVDATGLEPMQDEFTESDRAHADRMLNALELRRAMSGIHNQQAQALVHQTFERWER